MPKKVDSNQAEIVADLRKVGATVLLLHEVGKGCPDLLVGFQGVNHLIEIKTRNGKLNTLQQAFFDNWRGWMYVARTSEEALYIIGVI